MFSIISLSLDSHYDLMIRSSENNWLHFLSSTHKRLERQEEKMSNWRWTLFFSIQLLCWSRECINASDERWLADRSTRLVSWLFVRHFRVSFSWVVTPNVISSLFNQQFKPFIEKIKPEQVDSFIIFKGPLTGISGWKRQVSVFDDGKLKIFLGLACEIKTNCGRFFSWNHTNSKIIYCPHSVFRVIPNPEVIQRVWYCNSLYTKFWRSETKVKANRKETVGPQEALRTDSPFQFWDAKVMTTSGNASGDEKHSFTNLDTLVPVH